MKTDGATPKVIRPTVLLILLLSVSTFAASPGQDLAVMDIGYGAAGIAQGGAVIARSQDTFSLYWNPAGLATTPISALGHTFTELDMGTTYYGLSWVSRAGKGAWVIGWNAMSIEDLEITEGVTDGGGAPVIDPETGLQQVRVIGNFDASDHVISFGYGMTMGKTSIGATLKGIIRDLSNESATGLGLDLGLQHSFSKSLKAGLVLSDVGQTHVDWTTGSQDIVRSCMKAGIALKTSMGLSLEVDLSTQVTGVSTEPAALAIGGQWALGEQLFLRAGYSNDQVSIGVGFHADEVRFDLAYTEMEDFRNPVMISLTMDMTEGDTK